VTVRDARIGGRTQRFLIAMLLVFASVVAGIGGTTSPAHADSAGSAMTVSGTGDFSNLKVTVSQTQHLIDQVVKVSWAGADQTAPERGGFSINYLQVMQCWADNGAAPRREQCQFGAGRPGGGGAHVNRRQVNGDIVDPLETYTTRSKGCSNVFVPFESVTGVTETCDSSQFFDANTTNEVDLARTQADGTGTVFFETQTATEAAGLGCGAPLSAGSGAVTGRRCWLVVVPRNNKEVDGSVRTIQQTNQLDSSPLSATNWSHRIEIPLDFDPIGAACKLGAVETPTAGHELITEAMSRWQGALCGAGTVYGFSQVPVDAVHRQLASPSPGLDFMTLPLNRADVASSGSLTYAPVALSGLALAFNIDRQYSRLATPKELGQEGSRFPQLNLTARLVAKLLTQSYRSGTDFGAEYLKNNPSDLIHDPDFLKYNPEFSSNLVSSLSVGDALEAIGQSDAAVVLWNWIDHDKSARAFIDGAADPWGMKVNPNYKGIQLPLDSFPKADLFCRTFPAPTTPLCTFDAHPYAGDMHAAAAAASQGNTLARLNFDQSPPTPGWKAIGGAPNGQQAVIAVTDTATAARFSLPTARLLNASGNFIGPTDSALLDAVSRMKTDATEPSVLDPNPAGASGGAYPLTMLTYAVTNPAAVSASDRAKYARLIDFAVGAGQTPGVGVGTLPDGYAPLPAALRSKAEAAASALTAYKPPSPAVPSGSTPPPATSGSSGAGTQGSVPAASGGQASGPPAAASAGDPATAGGTVPGSVSLASSTTVGVLGGPGRFAVLGALVLGMLAAVAGPLILTFGRSTRT
jgi:hypothetical protein